MKLERRRVARGYLHAAMLFASRPDQIGTNSNDTLCHHDK